MRPHAWWASFLLFSFSLAAVRPAGAQWQVQSKDGAASLKVGFLAQPQMEVLDTPDTTGTSKNLFLRRFRLMFGGQIAEKWTFFFETDNPNLGKANPDRTVNPNGVTDAGFMYLQDAFVTYHQADAFKVDAGMLLTPLGRNHGQSAATLLPVDYGPCTFMECVPIGERVGRDYGVQARGYPLGQHLEYRLGLFQGVRGAEARNGLRLAGRVVWYPFEAETGFFYGGTFQGRKRMVALGAAFDRQDAYREYGADLFVEQPLRGIVQGVTFQFDWMRFDGGTQLKTLPKQDTYLVEAALHLAKGRLSPFVQASRKDVALPAAADQRAWQAGVAYWMAGHQRNVKISAGRQHTTGLPGRTQVLVQMQVFYY